MARIISEPPYDSWSDDIECEGCACIYRVDHNDVFRGGGSQLEPGSTYFYVHCPKCRRSHKFDKATLPTWLQKTAQIEAWSRQDT